MGRHLHVLVLRTQWRKQHPILDCLDVRIALLHIFALEPVSQHQLPTLLQHFVCILEEKLFVREMTQSLADPDHVELAVLGREETAHLLSIEFDEFDLALSQRHGAVDFDVVGAIASTVLVLLARSCLRQTLRNLDLLAGNGNARDLCTELGSQVPRCAAYTAPDIQNTELLRARGSR